MTESTNQSMTTFHKIETASLLRPPGHFDLPKETTSFSLVSIELYYLMYMVQSVVTPGSSPSPPSPVQTVS